MPIPAMRLSRGSTKPARLPALAGKSVWWRTIRHRGKTYRTTIWKNTGVHKQENVLLLALARGHEPIRVSLPSNLADLPPDSMVEIHLVWDWAARRYFWHLVVEDGQPSRRSAGGRHGCGGPGRGSSGCGH
jgi:hypothetical protein